MHRVKEWACEREKLDLCYLDWYEAQRELGIDIWVTNTVLGSSIFTSNDPLDTLAAEPGVGMFARVFLAWIDGVWCNDLHINTQHIVMTRKLTTE